MEAALLHEGNIVSLNLKVANFDVRLNFVQAGISFAESATTLSRVKYGIGTDIHFFEQFRRIFLQCGDQKLECQAVSP